MSNKLVYTKQWENFTISPGIKLRLYKKGYRESLNPRSHYLMQIPLLFLRYQVSSRTNVTLGFQGFEGFEYTYKDDKRNGLIKEYYQNGQLKGEGSFKDDKRNGLIKGYHENGIIGAEVNFKDDKQDGIERAYYPNGEIQYIHTYKNGKLIHRKDYDEKGKLINEEGE